ncbi:MAG: hypothetical protein EOO40_11035 [Deltaproteobacteria bacterium]|nr:MAG: hypothetical protein EOO40_11035 [Deltaproteobacteria bacterium]
MHRAPKTVSMRRHRSIALAFSIYFVSLPGAAQATASRAAGGYCDAIDYLLKQRHETAAWAQLEAALATAFDAAGAASAWPTTVDNWTPLRWRCSVATDTGNLLGCAWLIVGSSDNWHKSDGWHTCVYVARCRVPVAGQARALPPELLTRDDKTLLTVPWPGQSAALTSVIAACLERASRAPICGQ